MTANALPVGGKFSISYGKGLVIPRLVIPGHAGC